MTLAIMLRDYGGPENLLVESIEVGDPGPGMVRVRQAAIGVNYIDIHLRRGDFKPFPIPYVPGLEAAGVIDAVGPDVDDLAVGDRVSYTGLPGAYAQMRLVPAGQMIKLPDEITLEQAAGMTMRGITAAYLLRLVPDLKAGDRILVHAAAGGVGAILSQWAKGMGVEVIGVVGNPAKREIALAGGCTHVIVRSDEDFAARVMEITGGSGVKVVLDSVGGDTFARSIGCLGLHGFLVNFGHSAGPIPPLDVALLSPGSRTVSHFSFFDYVRSPQDMRSGADALFDQIARGTVKIDVAQSFPLSEAAAAHRALESGETTGSTILTA
jgi:NADPH:quinone reductase